MQNSNNPKELNGDPSDRAGGLQPMVYNADCNICYPEIYYRIQPVVMSVCDQIHSRDDAVLNQETFDRISDNIYAFVSETYPDLAEYACCHEMRYSVESLQRDFDGYDRDRDYDHDRRDRDRGDHRYRFRRRGMFRDFIDLLLLNELIRRGRYYPHYPYYPYSY